jgi:hypothetical protein
MYLYAGVETSVRGHYVEETIGGPGAGVWYHCLLQFVPMRASRDLQSAILTSQRRL